MEPMNLLVVENGADWSQWPAATQLLGQAGVVLVQQSDETGAAFRARISARMRRVKARAINAVLLLRSKRSPAAGVGNGRFLRAGRQREGGLRIFRQRRLAAPASRRCACQGDAASLACYHLVAAAMRRGAGPARRERSPGPATS